jgi:histidine ammonia-lyase
MHISLTGEALTIDQVSSLVNHDEIEILFEEGVLSNISRARAFLDANRESKVIYGVNTGFGPMASHLIGVEQLSDLQRNLIFGHAVGMGQTLPHQYVLAAMLVRLNTLTRGHSGVSTELVEHLRAAINHRIVPLVPEHGAVGTSGDLVQLAHIALGLLGEGQVRFRQNTIAARQAWEVVGLSPYVLKPKEGLSLINGTSFMSGIAALMCSDVERLLSLATRIGAWAFELVRGFDDGLSQRFHALRPHAGQVAVAQALRELMVESQMVRRRAAFQAEHRLTNETYRIDEDVQEIYSLRCIPQIIGPMLDAFKQACNIVETEINAVTDNPVVDVEYDQFWHGGHFHGEYIAMVADQLRASVVKLMMLAERRISFFLNERRTRSLPPFLNMKTPGLTLALQGLQFVATSTTAHGQTLAYPHRIHSISTNADNQDVVSMGSDSALLTMKVIEDAFIVLAIEAITLAQATDVMGIRDQLSPAAQQLYASLREQVEPIIEDRVLVDDLPRVVTWARTTPQIAVNWRS